MRNPLQEQLLKAGLAKKTKIDQVAREQAKQRNAKTPVAPAAEDRSDVDRLRVEKAERDRALSAERNAQAKQLELRAQARQIIDQNKIKLEGDIEYRFTHEGAIRSILVNDSLRRQLAQGQLVIARLDAGYAVIPRVAVEKVEAREGSMIVLDHGRPVVASPEAGGDDDYYSKFKVPDDLIW